MTNKNQCGIIYSFWRNRANNRIYYTGGSTIKYLCFKSKLTNQSLNSIYEDSICPVFIARKNTVGWHGRDKIHLQDLFSETNFTQTITVRKNNVPIKYRSVVLNWGTPGQKLMFVLYRWKNNNIILASKYFSKIQPEEMIQSYFNHVEFEDQNTGKGKTLISSTKRHISVIVTRVIIKQINEDFLQVETIIVSTSFYEQTVNFPFEICNNNSILTFRFILLKECVI